MVVGTVARASRITSSTTAWSWIRRAGLLAPPRERQDLSHERRGTMAGFAHGVDRGALGAPRRELFGQ